jgi:signal transduction histidine kinase
LTICTISPGIRKLSVARTKRLADRSPGSHDQISVTELLNLTSRRTTLSDAVATTFRTIIGHRLEVANRVLAARWLERLKQLVPVAAHEIFPGEQLLGHAPTLISELAAFFQAPAHESLAANAVVTARAAEIGQLRYAQRASVHQVLREYRTLREVLAEYIKEEIADLPITPVPAELVDLMNRLDAAVDVVLQTTVDTFVAEYTRAITEHATRLEGFNRMVTHELRQPLGVLQFALKRLGSEDVWSSPAGRDRVLATAERNVVRMNETLGKLVQLSRTAGTPDSALVQRVDLSAVAADVVEQLREMAEGRGVQVRIASPLPTVTIDIARLELALVNLVSNAIKYSDPDKPVRVVEIESPGDDGPLVCTLAVRDNGIGIAEQDLRSIFARFYRGHSSRDRELGTSGLGLGLSIVADCVDALKGDIRVESTLGEGTTFFLELPLSPQ